MTIGTVRATLEQLRSHGDQIAIEHAGITMDYQELQATLDEIAAIMRTRGNLKPGSRVIITSLHTPHTVALMLACIQAGLTYAPVPKSTPDVRLNKIRQSVGAAAHATSVLGDLQLEPLSPDSTLNHNLQPLTAILHTSGSTGTPKSVAIEAPNLDHFLSWCREVIPLNSRDRIAMLSPLHFDLCTHDIFHGLGSGATLVFPSEVEQSNPQATARFINERGITRVYMVPTFLEAVASALLRSTGVAKTVDTVMFAGERLSSGGRKAVESAFPGARLFNLYGPIETNVITARELSPGSTHDSSDVGTPLPGVHLAVRQNSGNITNYGRGELLAGGSAVTPGYLHNDHNAEKFVTYQSRRFYRTGDEATLSSDGVKLHGRLDSMVKIRGQRVEIDEVEAQINTVSEVSQTAVVRSAIGDSLEAFIVVTPPEKNSTGASHIISRVVTHCRATLPGVAIPSQVHVVDSLPQTTTGKIDRTALTPSNTSQPTSSKASKITNPVDAIEEFLTARLDTPTEHLRSISSLREHPSFNSLIAAECIEAVEDRLGCSADYDKLTSSSFDSIDSMGALFDCHH